MRRDEGEMRILFVGDVVGRAGRQAVVDHLPGLRESLDLDFVVVNGENAAHGFGITDKICLSFYQLGADVITTGNHVWDQREIMNYIGGDPKLLRPMNYPAGTPGTGFGLFRDRHNRKILVLHAMGRLFMDPLDDPFASIDRILAKTRLADDVAAILVDFHAEATSEKLSMAHYLDGRVTAVVGTHTHVPTADHQILRNGTAYQTDIGMTGDYDSVIGMKKETAVARFATKLPQGCLEPAEDEATLCGLFVECDDATGLARRAEPVRIGGRLAPVLPRSS